MGLRDVLFDQVIGSYSTNHAECIQTWSGPDRFLIDALTCNTTYQGLFLQPNQYGGRRQPRGTSATSTSSVGAPTTCG